MTLSLKNDRVPGLVIRCLVHYGNYFWVVCHIKDVEEDLSNLFGFHLQRLPIAEAQGYGSKEYADAFK